MEPRATVEVLALLGNTDSLTPVTEGKAENWEYMQVLVTFFNYFY